MRILRCLGGMSIWLIGYAIADYVFPANLARQWVMLWGYVVGLFVRGVL